MTSDKEESILRGHLEDLASESYSFGKFTFTEFLGLRELAVYESVKPSLMYAGCREYGGAEDCERLMVRFGDEESLGYSVPFPIKLLRISPASEKFAEQLTHRDILGAVMNLGIERDTIGDIIMHDGSAFLFAHERIAEHIIQNLTRASHTAVKVSAADSLPEGAGYSLVSETIQVASERADGVIAKVFRLNREDTQRLFSSARIFLNGKAEARADVRLRDGDKVTVRGFGRFIYRSYETLSRKGKLNARVELYK